MKAKGRYENREVLGEGGMGIVYRAFDTRMNREVTVKTIRDPQDKAVLELFKRECAVLASMTHPNIVEIFDVGETEEAGARRPYFVMPLLRGATLQELIRASSPRLTVERSVQMIGQVCRGLQAAHDHDLVHRDLKPSNLFVLPDDSVKIIDFGMAHLANHRSATGLKGTLPYMAPEQLQMKQQPTPLSDQFSLAVVCYEMLARRHPFSGAGQEDLVQAIVHYTPPPVSEFNPLVNSSISQVIHKALAKDPFHRFSDIRKFSDCLQKALRGEPIDIFDPARIAPRLQQAHKAFDLGDFDDAAEIVSELEAENYLTPEIGQLRKQIDEIRHARTVKQLLETARRRFDEGEYIRALQKVQEVLNLDPTNIDAFTLKGGIESKRSGTQIEEWFHLANQHMENYAYAHARQALEKVLDLRPKESRAQALLAEVERREQEHIRLCAEKQQAYQSALDAYKRGDINSALNKLERVLDLDRRTPYSTSPEQGTAYQKLYEEVRSRRDQLSAKEAEARRHLNGGSFTAAGAICDEVLSDFPDNVLFRFLRDDVEQAQRQEISAFVAKVEKEVAAEPDLNRRVSILEEARQKYPSESRLGQSLEQVQSRRDRVDSIAGRARTAEEGRQFSEALGLWETLRSIYPQYPGLDIEIDRLHKRREQQARADVKAHWVTQIDQALAIHNYAKATSLAADALVEFPGEAELSALSKQGQQAEKRALEAEEKTSRGKALYSSGDVKEALDQLREAFQLAAHNPMVRGGLLEVLLKEASRQVDTDWRAAELFVQEALELDPSNPLAKSVCTLIQDKRQDEEISAALSRARELQAQNNIRGAILEMEKIRDMYPHETRLIQFRASLQEGLSVKDREALRAGDLEGVYKLAKESKETNDARALESIFQKSHAYSKYEGDADFRKPLAKIEERFREGQKAVELPDSKSADPNDGAVIEEPPIHETLRTTKDALALWNAFLKKWKASLHDMKPTFLWTGVGFGVVALALMIVIGLQRSGKPGPKTEDLASRLVTVAVKNAKSDEYKILDNSGTDVTGKSAAGLSAGAYRLVAAKFGFQTVKLPFTINRLTGSQKILDLQWQALPAELRVTLTRPVGSLKIDGIDQTLDNPAIKIQWRNGPHSILWAMSDADSVEIQFEVNATAVTMKNPVSRGSVFGLVAVLSKTEVTYQVINVPGGIAKVVDDQSEPLPSAGSFSLPITQLVSFKVKHGGYPLGNIQVDPNGQPVIYVHLVTQRPSPGGGKRRSRVETPTEAPPDQPPSVISPTLIEEERRQKAIEDRRQEYWQKLGVSDGTQKQ